VFLFGSVSGFDGQLRPNGNVGVISSTRLSEGEYLIEFDRLVFRCIRIVSLGSATDIVTSASPRAGEIAHNLVSGAVDTVKVGTFNSSGVPDDRDFNVLVACD
jgi:hypothetical protein